MIEMGVFVMKYTLKEKLRYVKMHLEENVPLQEIERKYGLKTETLKYFCWLYKVHGEKARAASEDTEIFGSRPSVIHRSTRMVG